MRNTQARFHASLALFFAAITGLSTLGLILDLPHAMSLAHILAEIAIILFSLGASIYMGTGWFRAHRAADSANQCLEKYRQGLGAMIDSQMQRWGLTAAERCTAILLLKGLSHKDIAERSGRSERTVRQHAVAVYRKSGQAGRAELAAFFMEDFLPPVNDVPGREEMAPAPRSAAVNAQERLAGAA